MTHDNDHSHAHAGHDHGSRGHHHGGIGHSHAPATFGRAFAIGIALNACFVIVEFAYGYLANSMALIADGGHNLSDVLGLLVAWIASLLAGRAPSRRFSYGLGATSILAALFNAVFLLVVVGALSWEAILRLKNPEPVAGGTVMIVAGIGILLNGFCAWLFASGRKGDLNIRGAFLHMLGDALVSAGVVVAALVIALTGWRLLDPIVSLAINAVIVYGTWSLLTGSLAMSLNAVPSGVDLDEVRRTIETLPGVLRLHDLHVWSLSTTQKALTCHLVMPGGHPGDGFLTSSGEMLDRRFGISHATIQIEIEPSNACRLEPVHVV